VLELRTCALLLWQVDLHKSAGMLATYTITGKKPAFHKTGVTRQYYIQAVSTFCF